MAFDVNTPLAANHIAADLAAINANWELTAVGVVTTAGDTVYATASKVLARLAIGTAYQVKRVNVGATAPEYATVTGTANQITVTNAAGTVTLSAPQDLHVAAEPSFAAVKLNYGGLRLYDSNKSHLLQIDVGSDLTANRSFTLTTGDAARTLTLTGDPTLSDWFDQAVKAASSPTFAGLSLGTGELTAGSINRASGTLTIEIGGASKINVADTLIQHTTQTELTGITYPGADSTFTLGTSGYCWLNIYGDAGVTACSDKKWKVKVKKSRLGLDFINKIDWIQWEWDKAKGKKLERTWHGALAQDVLQALEDLGYTHNDFGGINVEDVINKTGQKTGENWGLRYEQFIGPLGNAIQELSARVMALEGAS